MAWYLDTSAFLKLFVREAESSAMRRWARAHADEQFSSDLLRTEVLRTARRISPRATVAARELLETLPLITLDRSVCDHAAELDPAILRSLDAIHLAAALAYGDELDGIVTYDARLAEAARRYGIAVAAPG